MGYLIQVILLLTGILMIASPGAMTRKDDRNNPEAVKRTKIWGYWIFFAGLIWVISLLFTR